MSEIKFKSDYGVYLCPHVFKKERPILEVIRDPDGCWQFFCGGDHDVESESAHYVAVGHLTEEDPSIHELTKMEIGSWAERKALGSEWEFGLLE